MNRNSPQKIAANRSNAQKSTGPKTARGKDMSKFNALTRGIFANTCVLPHEDESAFIDMRVSVYSELQPHGVIAETFADQIAFAIWRTRRLDRVEKNFLESRIQTFASNRQYAPEAEAIRKRNHPESRRLPIEFYDAQAAEIEIIEMRRKMGPAKSQASDLEAVLEEQICRADDSKVLFLIEQQRQSLMRSITRNLAAFKFVQENLVPVIEPAPNGADNED